MRHRKVKSFALGHLASESTSNGPAPVCPLNILLYYLSLHVSVLNPYAILPTIYILEPSPISIYTLRVSIITEHKKVRESCHSSIFSGVSSAFTMSNITLLWYIGLQCLQQHKYINWIRHGLHRFKILTTTMFNEVLI